MKPTKPTLLLLIQGQLYGLTRLPQGCVSAAWKLSKLGGESYTVHRDQHGVACTCGDFLFRRANKGSECKHIAALREVKLLESRNG